MSAVAELPELPPAEAAQQVTASADAAWTRRFINELDQRIRTEPLERMLDLWDLSGAAAARLFGVSRQAFARWRQTGPPASRAVQVADLAAVTDLLDRYLKRERIAAVVRRPAPALDGRSLLDIAADGDTATVLIQVREMFDLRRVQP